MSLFSRAPKPVRLIIGLFWLIVGIVGVFLLEPVRPWAFGGLVLVWLAGFHAGHAVTIEDQEVDERRALEVLEDA